jgi:hypothetical protein
MEEKEPIGFLFNSIPYYTQDNLNNVIDNMSQEQVVFFVTQALQYSFSQGSFNMLESEIVSKSIRKLNTIE